MEADEVQQLVPITLMLNQRGEKKIQWDAINRAVKLKLASRARIQVWTITPVSVDSLWF